MWTLGSIVKAASVIIFLTALVLYFQFAEKISATFAPSQISLLLSDTGYFAPVVFMAAMALTVASPLPSLPLDIAAGVFFGPWLGTLYSATGALLGSIISFSIARLLGRTLIERLLGGHINFCTPCSDRLLTLVIFITRLIPVVSFDMVSYGAGLTKVSLRRFSIATFLGMLPLTFLVNSYGSVVVVNSKLAVAGGVIMVLLFFLLPIWVERYAPLAVRDIFRHRNGADRDNEQADQKNS